MEDTIDANRLGKLRALCQELYRHHNEDVPFHGWHHVEFVVSKTAFFAHELGADASLAVAAAYTHDLNYLVDRRKVEAAGGAELRQQVLFDSGLTPELIDKIERVVIEAETAVRTADISREAQALSDADTLFKALPITPIIFAPLFMEETGYSLRQLAEKIADEQIPLQDQEIYFYSKSARRKYGEWGRANLRLWQHVLTSLDDPDVVALLEFLGKKV